MAKIKNVIDIIEKFSPESMTDPDFDDNVGLLVGSDCGDTEKVLVCLDATESVVSEAAALGARLILAHHPIIFRPVSSITDNTPVGRTIISALKNDIAIYSAHTNVDFCDGGINDYNAELIGIANPLPMKVSDGVKIGRYGSLAKDTTLCALTALLAGTFNDKYARYVGDNNAKIRRVAIINGGAGNMEFAEVAINLNVDCYVSADFPHHILLHCKESGINIIQLQHFSMEHVYIKRWVKILSETAETAKEKVVFIQSKSERNPTESEEV